MKQDNWVVYEITMHHKNMLDDLLIEEKENMKIGQMPCKKTFTNLLNLENYNQIVPNAKQNSLFRRIKSIT
jgi:hypothetical protein